MQKPPTEVEFNNGARGGTQNQTVPRVCICNTQTQTTMAVKQFGRVNKQIAISQPNKHDASLMNARTPTAQTLG